MGRLRGFVRAALAVVCRRGGIRVALPILAAAVLLPSARSARADVILVVDTTADTIANDGLCSLREAITAANDDANYFGCLGSGGGFDLIEFALGAGTPLIQLASPLPAITDPVAIDGGPGRVELRGSGSGSGLFVTGAGAAGSSIRGLVLNGFTAAIFVQATSNVTIAGNFIGTDATGASARPNSFGIRVAAASVRIGGTAGWVPGGSCTGDCNLISGNTRQGIDLGLGLSQPSSAVVQGNVIGPNATGTAALGNETGILLDEAQATVGGAVVGGGNLISGNLDGIELVRRSDFAIATFIQANRIGTNTSGSAAIANGTGIRVDLDNQDHPVVIGGTTSQAGNLISGNLGAGIRLQLADFVVIQGNRIGTRANGTDPLPNGGPGIELASSTHDNFIGGVAPGEANVIAFNATGVTIGVFDYFNRVRGNSIRSNVGKGIALADGQMNTITTPVITGVSPVSGTACPGCIVDVYSDAADEGGLYEGSTTANGIGSWTYVGSVLGPNVTATATSPLGSTSEFAAPVPEPSPGLLLGAGVVCLAGAGSIRRSGANRARGGDLNRPV